MYAVIETGGKQYRVTKNEIIKVERLPGDVGHAVEFNKILAVHDDSSLTLDPSALSRASVKAEIVNQIKSDKIIVFKKKPRHNYRRKRGHRQYVTVLKITDIHV